MGKTFIFELPEVAIILLQHVKDSGDIKEYENGKCCWSLTLGKNMDANDILVLTITQVEQE